MELNYFKDHLFDLLNESNILNVRSITADDKENVFVLSSQTVRNFALNAPTIPRRAGAV